MRVDIQKRNKHFPLDTITNSWSDSSVLLCTFYYGGEQASAPAEKSFQVNARLFFLIWLKLTKEFNKKNIQPEMKIP